MASLINFRGSTGVELIGIVLNSTVPSDSSSGSSSGGSSGGSSGSSQPKPILPSSGMIALLQVSWEIPVQLENFIASLNESQAGGQSQSGSGSGQSGSGSGQSGSGSGQSVTDINKTVQLLTVRPAPGQAVLSYAVVPASGDGFPGGFGFPGGNLPIIAIGGSNKPEIKVYIRMQRGNNTVDSAGFKLVNAVPIGQTIEMSAEGGQGAPPFTAIASIIYVFDEISPIGSSQ